VEPYYTLLNPGAGGKRAGRRFPAWEARLRARGVELEVVSTQAPGHAVELARAARAAGRRRFLAVGGDGTTFEVVDGLLGGPRGAEGGPRPVLASLPLGSGNSFLRDFGLLTPEAAVEAIARGASRPVDAVRAEHAGGALHFLNLLSVGFSARAGALMNRRFKALGRRGYDLAVLLCAARMRHHAFRLRSDAGAWDERPCTLLAFCNSRYTGGSMRMAPAADPADGRLDVIRIGPLSGARLVGSFPRIFRGAHVDMPETEVGQVRRVEFDLAGPVDCMIDGEVLELELRALEIVPAALEVVA
jgi:diacylglycerol kinase family enzyme